MCVYIYMYIYKHMKMIDANKWTMLREGLEGETLIINFQRYFSFFVYYQIIQA